MLKKVDLFHEVFPLDKSYWYSTQKAHSKVQGVLSLAPLPKIDEFHAMLNGSTVYSSFDCTYGYCHITLSPKAPKKPAFVTPIGKFELKKVPFSLVQALTNFQQLINEVLKGLPFAFGYLYNILNFSGNADKHFKHLRTVFDRLRTANLKLK